MKKNRKVARFHRKTTSQHQFLLFVLVLILFVGIGFLLKTVFYSGDGKVAEIYRVEPTKSMTPEITVNSLDSLRDLNRQFAKGTVVTVKIPKHVYRLAYIAGVKGYIKWKKTDMLGEPIDTDFISSNVIKGTVAYGPQFEKGIVDFWYSFYIGKYNKGEIGIKVKDAEISGRKLTPAEKGTIESALDPAFNYLWNIYYQYIEPLAISNDANFLYLRVRIIKSVR